MLQDVNNYYRNLGGTVHFKCEECGLIHEMLKMNFKKHSTYPCSCGNKIDLGKIKVLEV